MLLRLEMTPAEQLMPSDSCMGTANPLSQIPNLPPSMQMISSWVVQAIDFDEEEVVLPAAALLEEPDSSEVSGGPLAAGEAYPLGAGPSAVMVLMAV